MGWKTLEAEEGRVRCEIPASEWFASASRNVYGGILALFADGALVNAVASTLPRRSSLASLDLSVNFLRPVFPDGRPLTAEARVVHRGKGIAVADVHIDNADGKPVVIAKETVLILEGRPWSEALSAASERLPDAHGMTERALPRRRIEANGLTFGVVDEGEGPAGAPAARVPRLGRPVAIPGARLLVEAGYRAIAPDLRGFGETDRPEGVDEYAHPGGARGRPRAPRRPRAVGESVRLVTHDWGAVVGWLLAAAHPELVDRLAALGVGYPSKRPTLEELEKYWYIFLWQLEGTAERVIVRSGWRLMREWLREGRPGRSPDLERSLEDLARPGALTAGLNWYRAFAQPEVLLEDELPLPPVACPVLAVWGEHDILPEARVTESRENVTGPWRYERFDGVGHWIPTEASGRLNPLLLEFLAD